MVNVIIENMTPPQRRKNLLSEEKENTPSNPEKTSLPLNQFLDQMGVDWEERGKALYIYPSSLAQVKELTAKMPLPEENQYVIIPLGTTNSYNVFIMITRRSLSIRIGYGRNSIPFSPSLSQITTKLEKVAKEIGIESTKGGKNLLGD